MRNKSVVAYWNIYDSETGHLIEAGKAIIQNSMPAIGGLIVGIPEKFHAIIRDFKFNGTKNGLPCYDVYI
ncbi:MAG: hypothetical protein PHI59_06955 [Candidatus Omnitrophica bacterium]|nr:hypothetical protein [Candidatus Omnitrophota bacterium]